MIERAIRTLIAEDVEILSLALRYTVRQMPELVLIGDVRDGQAAIDKAIALCADLVLMDTGLPLVDGIEVTRQIKRSLPAAKVVLITSHLSTQDVVAGLTAGADAYCAKGMSPEQLTRVIRAVADGGLWLDPSVAPLARGGCLPPPIQRRPTGAVHAKVSPREKQVLQLVAAGLTNQEIADKLEVGSETIKTHVRHLMDKMGATDRTQIAVHALLHGLLNS